MVPNLITALTGRINELEARMLDSMPAIERWFRLEWMEHTPPFYTSVDLRNAGFKLAPVDTSLFPSEFDNLTDEMLPLAVQAAMAAIEKICPEAKNLLLIPEDHGSNESYLGNLARLTHIFHLAGLNVRLGTLDRSVAEPSQLALPDGNTVTLEPLVRPGRRLGLKAFDPCTVLLNNDLASGMPKVLENLHEQYLLPPLHAGWTVRRKSNHFQAYDEVAKKFAKLLGMDPWLIDPMFAQCGKVDFNAKAGVECVQSNVDTLLAKIRRKYKEYGIADRAFVIVKPDDRSGGVGVETVRESKDVAALVERARAAAGQGGDGESASNLIIQEGVPTCERIEDAPAEPVVYMIDRYVVGGFYRVNPGRGNDESLAGPGARIVRLAFADAHHLPKPGAKAGASAPNRFYMYGVIGRLAMLAASYELEATDPDAEIYD